MSEENQYFSKSYCQTKSDVTTLDFTWEINDFWQIYILSTHIHSEPFPEEPMFYIIIQGNPEKYDNIQFYMIAKKVRMPISYDIYMAQKKIGEKLSHCTSQVCVIKERTLLYEITKDDLLAICPTYEALVLQIKFRFYHENSRCETIHFGPFKLPHIESLSIISSPRGSIDSNIDIQDDSLITVVIDRNTLEVRKDILSSSSPVFKKMIAEAANNTSQLVLSNISYSTFEEIILFITTGVANFEEIGKAKELLKIADQYDIKELKFKCEQHFVHHINLLTAIELMEVAILNNAKYLEEHVANFIKLHIKILVRLLKFENMHKYPKAAEAIEAIAKSKISSTRYKLNEIFV